MSSFNNCGSDVIIYSAIISVLLSCTLTPDKKDLIGNILLSIGQSLVTAESACESCEDKISNVLNNDCSYYPFNQQQYYS